MKSQQLDEKNRIAAAAAAVVTEGSAIGLTAGTTTWAMAKHLVGVPDLTVVTNSTLIAQVLYDSSNIGTTVILTGGARTPSDALVGPVNHCRVYLHATSFPILVWRLVPIRRRRRHGPIVIQHTQ